jgi:hypothetical protein
MKPEKQNLIRDLLDENPHREATLLAGARILRHRRQWRAVRQTGLALGLIVAAAALALRKESPAPARVASVAPSTAPVSQVHEMNDEELLSLFPNTPVALASLPDGTKRLLFPRHGDEQKFIKRL